jgi:Zincin-like metallopeptidase
LFDRNKRPAVAWLRYGWPNHDDNLGGKSSWLSPLNAICIPKSRPAFSPSLNVAAFLAAEFSFDGDVRHAGYIATWIGLLRGDKRAFFTAASRAQAAADYLRGLALAEPIARAA